MPGTHTIILGGGVGGIVTANTLRKLLPREHTITVIEKRESFFLGATKTWVMMGDRTPEEVSRPVRALERRGIRVMKTEVTAFDPAKREVKAGRRTLRADYLVVALGAAFNVKAVDGLDAAETFYTMDGALRLRKLIRDFRGGEIVILNPRVPIQCPPAPYEGAFLLDHFYQLRGNRDRVRLSIHTIEPAPMPTAGPQVGQVVREELGRRNIAYHTQRRVKRVDGASKKVLFEDGAEIGYDLLITVPPHEAPAVVRSSGLTNQGGWVPVDPKTLQTSATRVFAIGDVTTLPLPGRYKPDVPLVLPKAAVFADAQGRVVASRIAAEILGREPRDGFEGKGFCFVEMGDLHALGGQGAFFEMPSPKINLQIPDMIQYQEKQEWVRKWMEENLG